jgi:diaminopimelate epimerase
MRFTKYEGLGNDFVVVDEAIWEASGRLAAAVCDRHFGVGADGVLVVGPGRSPGAAGSMTVWNADGSRPEMCGNGLRCVAIHLAWEQGLRGGGSFVVDTDSGPRGCEVTLAGGPAGEVRVDMGSARIGEPAAIEASGRVFELGQVSMGNPHAIAFVAVDQAEFLRVGPQLATHPAFPAGANVEFVSEGGEGVLEVKVWERGSGPTLACGTGACAVAALACEKGLRRHGDEVRVRLPGGELKIRVLADRSVTMQGPARRVFSGELSPQEGA